MIISRDAEKAYDNIWYALKIKILSKLGIERKCLNQVKIPTFKNLQQTLNKMINWNLSLWERNRQSWLLFTILFDIVLQALASPVRLEKEIIDIPIG